MAVPYLSAQAMALLEMAAVSLLQAVLDLSAVDL
jgi:hypothetical protein